MCRAREENFAMFEFTIFIFLFVFLQIKDIYIYISQDHPPAAADPTVRLGTASRVVGAVVVGNPEDIALGIS